MSLSAHFPESPPSSPSSVLTAHRTLAAHLTSTTHEPYVYPYRALGPYLFIFYLLLPPPTSSGRGVTSSPLYAKTVYHLRWPVFLVASALCIQATVECKSPLVTVGYGIGIINAWSVLWMGCWTVFGDGRGAKRIEGQKGKGAEVDRTIMEKSSTNVNETNREAEGGLHRRQMEGNNTTVMRPGEEAEDEKSSGFIWQGLPHSFSRRVDWVADLTTNFRGIRWSHQISGLPYPDASSLSAFAQPMSYQSSSSKSIMSSSTTSQAYPTRSAVIRSSFIAFVVNLVVLDILKYLMLQDTYFWGVPDPGPSPYPFPRAVRLVLSLAGVYSALLSIFLLSPLVYCGLAGEKYLGEHAWPWLYPSYYGSPAQVWEKGLAGMWGGWWHQLFRLGFEQAGEFIGSGIGWDRRTVRGGILRVSIAFLCSACIHACGSHTSTGDTRPRDAFLFFAFQPIGLLIQRAVAGWMKKSGLRDRIPASFRGACNLGLAVGWCWLTGPLIADDFARAGIWLYEPMPFSLTRGLAGEGWWRWGGAWARWHSADRWWKSGIAV